MTDALTSSTKRLTLVRDLAVTLRERVVPELGGHAGRAHAGDAEGGDVTFAVDEIAETSLAEFLGERAPRVAFYSEDRGLVAPPDATEVLVVDPIDGTRPALAGLESCCVAVALAPLGDGDPTMGDVSAACVVEIKSGGLFLAAAGEGLVESPAPALSANVDLGRMFWSYGFRGRPARATVEVLAELIDGSSVGGGVFDLGSQAFGMTRIVTGQLDAVVEVGSRMIDEVPGMRSEFERVGGGQVLNNSPYDLAAPWLCLREAGGVISDGWGRSLEDRRLLGSGHDFQMSSISAANTALHDQLVRAVETGIQRLIELHS
ncbi:MAG: inositol monophosphatase family protein [Solirubrobacteraceae bacterium]